MNKTALLIGGVGLGAGLIYILDPERGENSAAPGHGRNSRDIGARLTTSGITPREALAVRRVNS